MKIQFRQRKSTDAAGFTIVEFLVATFIFSAVVAGAAAFAAYFFQNYYFSFESNQAIGLAQNALTQTIREIREARSADDGAYTIIETADNSFTFYSDVTGDGRTDKVRYFLNGTNLQKGVIEPTSVPVTYPTANEKIKTVSTYINNLGQPIFVYYNGNWPSDTITNPLPQSQRLLNTRYVTVYLRIDISASTSAQPFELSSGVQIRSLKNNL